MSSRLTVGFLGAGKMATALARGFIRARLVTARQVVASDPNPAARAAFTQESGARAKASNAEVALACHVLILAVKPDYVATVVGEIRGHLKASHLLISIVAGYPLARLE